MEYNVCLKYIANAFCTVKVDSEDEILDAIENGNFSVYYEDAADEREVFLIDDNDNMRKIN